MKAKVFLTLALALLFSFTLNAQENKKEAKLLKKEAKIQKELHKINKDKTYDFQKQKINHQRPMRQMEVCKGRECCHKMQGRIEGRMQGRMQGSMQGSMQGRMQDRMKHGQMQGRQMNPEHLKFRLELEKSLKDGSVTPEQAKEKMEKFRGEMIEKRLEMISKDSTNHFRGQRFHKEILENKDVEKQEPKIETVYWTKENMYNLPMDEFSKYIQYKE